MSNKQKKKRNKVYRGVDAALDRPIVTRIEAADRSRVGQWWFDHKRIARPIIIGVAVVLIIGWLIFELVRIAGSG